MPVGQKSGLGVGRKRCVGEEEAVYSHAQVSSGVTWFFRHKPTFLVPAAHTWAMCRKDLHLVWSTQSQGSAMVNQPFQTQADALPSQLPKHTGITVQTPCLALPGAVCRQPRAIIWVNVLPDKPDSKLLRQRAGGSISGVAISLGIDCRLISEKSALAGL